MGFFSSTRFNRLTTSASILLLAVALGGCQLVRLDRPGTTPPEDAATDEVRDFARAMNRHRQTRGCPVLTWDEALAKVAERHTDEMARFQYLSHTNRSGQSPFKRLELAGIRYTRAAENIAQGQRTAEVVLHDWLISEGHRKNIEECRFTHHGAAMVNGYWTHVFITAR